jgi:hypothetical protein
MLCQSRQDHISEQVSEVEIGDLQLSSSKGGFPPTSAVSSVFSASLEAAMGRYTSSSLH